MRFLCLPGAFCNAKAFKTQLGPFCDRLLSDGSADFYFTQGTTPFTPPPGLEDFFGPPPNFTFAEVDDPDLINFNILDFPRRDTPEDTMKFAMDLAGQPTFSSIRKVMERLIGILDTEDDIAGVIGYSEGAKIAATLILEEERRRKQHGRAPRLKCAVLVCGWPVLDPETGATILAADEDSDDEGEMITIPTCHVVGAADPFLDASMALYNVCDPDTAELFDHGGGHVIPRGKQTVDDLADVVREMILSVDN